MSRVSSSPKIKHLKLNLLSIVKFFHKKLGKRVLDQAFIQPILYLVYLEVLQKENLLLFQEEFRAWESSPILESVFWHLPSEEKDLKKMLREAEDIDNDTLLKHLEKIAKKYGKLEACELQFEAKDAAWEKAYESGFIRPISESRPRARN